MSARQCSHRASAHACSLNRVKALDDSTCQGLFTLLTKQSLSDEMILRLTVILIGVHRSSRSNGSVGESSERQVQSQAESFALFTLLSEIGVLFEVAIRELQIVQRTVQQAILDGTPAVEVVPYPTPTLCAILPSLRITVKWITINYDYLGRHNEGSGHEAIQSMWTQYRGAIQELFYSFSIGTLPSSSGPMQEDQDLRGFLPLAPALGTSDITVDPSHFAITPPDEQSSEWDVGSEDDLENEDLARLSDLFIEGRLTLGLAVCHCPC